MFCKNCGSRIDDNVAACPVCGVAIPSTGAPQTPVTAQAPVAPEAPYAPQAPVVPEAPYAPQAQEMYTQPADATPEMPYAAPAAEYSAAPGAYVPPASPKKFNGKKIGIIAAIVAVVAALIVAAVVWLPDLFKDKKASDKKEEPDTPVATADAAVKNYLDFIASKNTDAKQAIINGYGCNPGSYYGTNAGYEINDILFKSRYEDNSSSMYYGEDNSSSTWQDQITSELKGFYNEMTSEHGKDWKLTYELGETTELKDAELEMAKNKWNNLVNYYDDNASYITKNSDTYATCLENMKKLEVSSAYKIEAKIKIGDSFNETHTFTIVKTGDNFVLVDGPSFNIFC